MFLGTRRRWRQNIRADAGDRNKTAHNTGMTLNIAVNYGGGRKCAVRRETRPSSVQQGGFCPAIIQKNG